MFYFYSKFFREPFFFTKAKLFIFLSIHWVYNLKTGFFWRDAITCLCTSMMTYIYMPFKWPIQYLSKISRKYHIFFLRKWKILKICEINSICKMFCWANFLQKKKLQLKFIVCLWNCMVNMLYWIHSVRNGSIASKLVILTLKAKNDLDSRKILKTKNWKYYSIKIHVKRNKNLQNHWECDSKSHFQTLKWPWIQNQGNWVPLYWLKNAKIDI